MHKRSPFALAGSFSRLRAGTGPAHSRPAHERIQIGSRLGDRQLAHLLLPHRLQAKHEDTGPAEDTSDIAPRLDGKPLDPATRAFFEPRFGVDFGAVRVHTDANAAASARDVNALAYTVGRDVVFNSGKYAPHSDSGKRLLAHELTHVVQQSGAERIGAGPLGVQRQWADAEKSGATSKKVQPPQSGSWNKDPVKIGSIWRIPVDGLTGGNQRDDTKDTAYLDDPSEKTQRIDYAAESAVGKAIVLVPEPLTVKKVDVLLYLHGFGVGYRQRTAARMKGEGKKQTEVEGMGAGTVRDVDVDRMEEQLANFINAPSGVPMVAVLPQGAYRKKGGKPGIPSFGSGFEADSYLTEVFNKVSKLQGITPGRVVLAGHSGAGGTIAPMLKEAVDGSKGLKGADQIKKEGGLRLPAGLAEVVLFDAINGSTERENVAAWLKAQMQKDVLALKGKSEADQKAYLQSNMMRFRGYYSKGSGYASRYETLKTDLKEAANGELKNARKAKVDPLILSAELEKTLRENYENAIHGVDASHERIMGTGKIEDALGALPAPGTGGASQVSPSPAPTPAAKEPVLRRMPASLSPVVQRQPLPGAAGNALQPLTAAEIPQVLVFETVQLTGGGTLLRTEDVQTAMDERASNAELSSAFDNAVRALAAMPFDAQPSAIRLQAAKLIKILELQFILDPNASGLNLLPPDRARRYRDFSWQRLDYPGRNEGEPAGPNESRARAMARELSDIRPERRANRTDASVVAESEFDRRMRRYVVDQLREVPGQEAYRLNRQALESFVRMRDAAEADGVELIIEASYRSPERARSNAEQSGNSEAVGEFSSHILGLAIDFRMSHGSQQYLETTTRPMQNVVDMRQSPAHKWLFLRGAAYGWYPLQNEPWHWEYNPPGFREQFRDELNPSGTTGNR